MPKETVQKGTSTLTLLLVAIIGGIVALALQPLILLLYSHLGIPTVPISSYQQKSNEVPVEQVSPTTTIVTTQKIETTTTTVASIIQSTTIANDPTVDEDPIYIKEEPVTIKVPKTTTTPKPVVTEKPKPSKSNNEKKSESKKSKEPSQQPEIIDVTGRNKQIPDEVRNFKATKISMSICI